MARFEPGDILLAATDVDDSNIDLRRLRGAGRILHLDHDFRLKNTLWTDQMGLVVGVGLHPQSKYLYTADPHNQNIMVFDETGTRLGPLDGLPARPYGSVAFDEAGRLLLGVHSARTAPPDDGYGEAKLFVYDAETQKATPHSPLIDGGRTGWHCVTNMTYDPRSGVLYYVSEAGHRIGRYDVRGGVQHNDFFVFEQEGARRTYGLGLLADGRMLAATGVDACLFSPDGEILREYDVPADKGWTRISLPSAETDYFYLNNFLDGVVQRRDIETGAVLAEHDIERKCSLCGLAEVRDL